MSRTQNGALLLSSAALSSASSCQFMQVPPSLLYPPDRAPTAESYADLLCSFQIDDKLEFRRLLDRQVHGLRPFEDLVYEVRSAAHQILTARGIGNEATILGKRGPSTHRWKPVFAANSKNCLRWEKSKLLLDDKRFRAILDYCAKSALELSRSFRSWD